MITIYHLETSRSERIVWLMEELGLKYKLEIFPREAASAVPSPLKAIHGLGKAPVIRDGDVVLAESGAIVEYIVHRHAGGRLAPHPDDPAYARYLYWLHFAEGSLMSLMLISLADVMMTFPFTTMRKFLDVDTAPYPNLLAYLQRIESRPAYQRAMVLAGPKTP